MARIWRHRDDELDALAAGHGPGRTKVVLDVAAPLNAFVAELAADRILELREDLVVGLPEDVGHDVQPPAMGHANKRLTDAGLGRLGNHFVEDRHEHVQPFDREARLARERPVQKTFEGLDVGEPVKERNRIDRIVRRTIAPGLDHLAQPLPFLGHEDVRDVVARRRTVDRPQSLDDIPHRVCALGDGTVEQRRRQRSKVCLCDAVRLRQKRGIAHRPAAKRIDFGRKVAVAPDRLREVDGADHEVRRRRTRATCRRKRRRAFAKRRPDRGRRWDTLEERARRLVNRRRICAEAIVKLEGGGGIDALKVFPVQRHTVISTKRAFIAWVRAVPFSGGATGSLHIIIDAINAMGDAGHHDCTVLGRLLSRLRG